MDKSYVKHIDIRDFNRSSLSANYFDKKDIDDLFVIKECNSFPIFTNRWKRKGKIIYFDEENIILEAGDLYLIKDQNRCRQFVNIPFHIDKACPEGATFKNKKNENTVGFLNFQTGEIISLAFEHQVNCTNISRNLILISTRESYDGPGRLHCFSYDGSCKWVLEFNEEIQNSFGLFRFYPYSISVTDDESQIFVQSFDVIYRISNQGKFICRVSHGDYEMEKKGIERAKIQDEEFITEVEKAAKLLASDIVNAMGNGFLHTSPNAIYYDSKTDIWYTLKDDLVAWNRFGKATIKIGILQEFGKMPSSVFNKIDNRYLLCLTDKTIIVFDEEFKVVRRDCAPTMIRQIVNIPNQKKCLCYGSDTLVYEYDYNSGVFSNGVTGGGALELMFLDAKYYLMHDGYLWRSQIGTWGGIGECHDVSTQDPKELNLDKAAPVINCEIPFNHEWSLKNPGAFGHDYGIDEFAIDQSDKYIFISRETKDLSEEQKKLKEAPNRAFTSKWNDICCFDSKKQIRWVSSFFSQIIFIALSKKYKNAVFVGVYGAKGPLVSAKIVVLSKSTGKEEAVFESCKIKKYLIPCQGIDQEYYVLVDEGGEEYEIVQGTDGKWQLEVWNKINHVDNADVFFLNSLKKDPFLKEFLKKDRKVYVTHALNNYKLLTGRREIILLDESDKPQWRIGAKPSGDKALAWWIDTLNVFIWVSGNCQHCQISMIDLNGEIIKNQIFENVFPFRIYVMEDCSNFVIRVSNFLECYKITRE